MPECQRHRDGGIQIKIDACVVPVDKRPERCRPDGHGIAEDLFQIAPLIQKPVDGVDDRDREADPSEDD